MSEILKTKVELVPRIGAFLHAMHDQQQIGDKQSMRNGTAGYIPMDSRAGSVVKLRAVLGRAITELLGHQDWGFTGLWSTRLPKGGSHVMHNHPKGWMSGILYVDVPTYEGGHLVFDDTLLIPQTGDVVMFPSETWHSVTEYQGDQPRLTVAFDLLKMQPMKEAA